jgi:hypothetical protein
VNVEEYKPLLRPFVSYSPEGFSLTYTDDKGEVRAMVLPEEWIASLQMTIAVAFAAKASDRLTAPSPDHPE